jgi:ABC-type proline/glycine betaine transport system substrate-binding protein/ABC-type sugar transport system substrate-binding protein
MQRKYRVVLHDDVVRVARNLAVALAFVLVMAACGGDDAENITAPATVVGTELPAGEGVKVGYISLGESVPFAKLVSDGIKEEAARFGVDLVFCDSELDAETAVACAQDFKVQGVEGVLNFQVFEDSSPEICVAHGDVPVIAIDIIQRPCQTAFMGANNRLAGQLAGSAMGEFIQNEFDCDYTAYVSLESTASGAANMDRMGGYREGFREHCPLINEHILDGTDRIDPALEQVTDLLMELPGERIVVVAINEDGILGAIGAAAALDRETDLYYSGQGTDPSIWCDVLNNPNYIASAAYFPERYGSILIPAILDAVQGNAIAPRLLTDHQVVTSENIEDIYEVGECDATPETTAATPETNEKPGEGVTVRLARANWDTGYFQAAVYKMLLGELGYMVTDPSQAELPPTEFYPALAGEEYDLWVNGWFPLHDEFLAAELTDGTLAGDKIQKIGAQMPAGALQGFVVDTLTAMQHGITTLDDIANDPAIAALFDVDGNGKADISGCNDGWGCQITINETIEFNGWTETIEQKSAEYSDLWADAVARAGRGEPVLAYTWTPTAYITQLIPGQDVIWLSLSQPLPDQVGAATLPAEQCPGQPCELGFAAADIQVVANNAFLDANPAAQRLLELVTIQVIDVALQNVRMGNGEDTQIDIDRHAEEWIQANDDIVTIWLTEARSAAG